MAWSPTPASPKHTWQGYDLCLNIYNDGMGDAIVALYKPVGTRTWLSMGNADGQVWWGDFIQEVTAMGFKAWLIRIVELIQKKLADWCKTVFPDTPVADPKDFVEFQAWAANHTTWVDAPKSVSASME